MSGPTLVVDTVRVDPSDGNAHLSVLDGWRGMSILLVLTGHMLPVGLRSWQLNEGVAATGMALFFVLSGFLITASLQRRPAPVPFLIKRLFRVAPLCWLFVIVVIAGQGAPLPVVWANMLFYANGAQAYLAYAPHLWSLSVEVQFYLFMAALVGLGGRRALAVLPLLALAVTAARIGRGAVFGIHTFDRVDEILAGATLAWLLQRGWRLRVRPAPTILVLPLVALIAIGSHPIVRTAFPVLAFGRPYLAAAAVGISLFAEQGGLKRALSSSTLRYVAGISYALYVLHPLSYAGWLGAGDRLLRYEKRVLSFLLVFGAAHCSTRWLERPLTRLGHRLSERWNARRGVVAGWTA